MARRRRRQSARPAVELFGLTYLGPCAVFVLPDPSHDLDKEQVFPRGKMRMVDKETLWRCTSDARGGMAKHHRSRWSACPVPQEPEGVIIGIEEAVSEVDSAPEPPIE